MTAMKFKGVSKLTEVYEKARGKNKPSLRMIDMGGAPGISVEAIFEDTRTGEPLTAIWYSELRALMSHADSQNDFEGGNPNYKVVDEALRQMTKMRQALGQPT